MHSGKRDVTNKSCDQLENFTESGCKRVYFTCNNPDYAKNLNFNGLIVWQHVNRMG
jgi:hypothetical protein